MMRNCLDTPPPAITVAAVPDLGAPPVRRPVHHARADCTADSDGGLTFEVRLFDGNGKGIAATGMPEGAAVLLRLRQHQGPDASLRLPLTRAAADDRPRATLASAALLREGRWDAFLALPDDEPQRLLPGVHDLRSLAGGVSRHAHAWLGVRVPYTTKHGNLTVRTWLRRPHAEAGPLRVAADGITLRASLYGARLTATACLEARPRDAAASPVRVPVRLDGEGDSVRETAPGYGAGSRHPECDFAAELPLEPLLSTPGVWDLWLSPSADDEPVRLARILDDVIDKKRVFSYPAQRVASPEGSEGAVRSVRPYYTVNNNLSVRVSDESA